MFDEISSCAVMFGWGNVYSGDACIVIFSKLFRVRYLKMGLTLYMFRVVF